MKDPKTITILCASFPPETGAGPNRIYLLAQLLQRHGYKVCVIAAMPNYPKGKIFKDYRGKLMVTEEIEGISVTRIWIYPTNSSSKIKRALNICSVALSVRWHVPRLLKAQRPDLLIVSSPPLILGSLGASIAARLGIKVMLNVSDIWPASAEELGFIREGRLLRYLRKLEQMMYERADSITVQSEEIRQHILTRHHNGDIFVYRNLQVTGAYAHQARPQGKRKVVYAGLLGVAQGVSSIIRHVNFGSLNTELHIYGSGVEATLIQQLAAERTDIFYHGTIPAKEVPEMLSHYHIMLVPLVTAIKGAVPSKIFNAVANGLPVLYMGQGEPAAIVRENKIGYTCDAGDFEGLYANLKQLTALTDTEYEQLRAHCYEAQEVTFNKERQDVLFLAFLEKLPG